ncbi:ATP-binding protein [Streptomyces sp. NPDC059176]|uniref:ATP-binding protein n=1 Tax=unclassified Streptomyces TaxID=2593676 RepID=UPI00369C18C2
MTTPLQPFGTGSRCKAFQLPKTIRTPSAARRLVRHALAEWLIPHDVLDTAQLLVSELVTNAVTHAEGPVGLLLLHTWRGGHPVLRVEVTDASTRPAQREEPAEQDEHGRGLDLVETLADRWGQDAFAHGKRIWCELMRPQGLAQGRRSLHRGAGGRLAP